MVAFKFLLISSLLVQITSLRSYKSSWLQVIENFTRPFSPRGLYILVDPAEIVAETRLCFEIMKSKERHEYVQALSVSKLSDVARQNNYRLNYYSDMIVSVANTTLTPMEIRNVSYTH